jgi:ribosome-associated protein
MDGRDERGLAVTPAVEPSVIAARAADAKKGEAILVLDVGEVLGIVGTFVIASASNARLVRAIVEEVEDRLREELGIKPRSVEGLTDASWVLLDYGDLVVHVFLEETREFYGLERLWADVPRIEWADAVVPVAEG